MAHQSDSCIEQRRNYNSPKRSYDVFICLIFEQFCHEHHAVAKLSIRDAGSFQQVFDLNMILCVLHEISERTGFTWSKDEIASQLRYIPLSSKVRRILYWPIP